MVGPARSRFRTVYSLDGRMKIISQLIRGDMEDPERGPMLRNLALSIVRCCPARGDRGDEVADACEATQVFNWIVTNVRYTGDVGPTPRKFGDNEGESVDLYASPLRVLQAGGGDCDCMVGVAVALMRFLGWDIRARVVSFDGETWAHVYPYLASFPKVGPSRREVVFDVTLGHDKIGVEKPYKKKRDFLI